MQKETPKGAAKRNVKRPFTNDEATILNEAAHIPDRDQVFGISHKQYPAPDPSVSAWEGDHEDEVKGDRDFKHDAVDELETIPSLIEGYVDRQTRASTPTTVYPAEQHDEFLGLDDLELHDRAEAMGIAGREQMSRPQLINALRECIEHM